MNLRNRISPQDKSSEPALSILDTDIMSSDSDSSDILSIPDTMPDHASELSSVLTRAGASQIRTTLEGLKNINYNIPLHRRHQVPIQRQQPTRSIEDQAITMEDVNKSMERKLHKQERKDIMRHLHKSGTLSSNTNHHGTSFKNQDPLRQSSHDERIEELQIAAPSSSIDDYTTPRLPAPVNQPGQQTASIDPAMDLALVNDSINQPCDTVNEPSQPVTEQLQQQAEESPSIRDENQPRNDEPSYDAPQLPDTSYFLGGSSETSHLKPKMHWNIAKTLTPESCIGFEIIGKPDSETQVEAAEPVDTTETALNTSTIEPVPESEPAIENEPEQDPDAKPEAKETVNVSTPSKTKKLIDSAKKLFKTPTKTPGATPKQTPTVTPKTTPRATPKNTPAKTKTLTPAKTPHSTIISRLRNRKTLKKPLKLQDYTK